MLDFLSAPHLTGDVKDVGAEATRNLLRIVENPFVQRTTNVLLGFLGVLLAYKVVGGLLTKASVLREMTHKGTTPPPPASVAAAERA
jgi:hypothetical protein